MGRVAQPFDLLRPRRRVGRGVGYMIGQDDASAGPPRRASSWTMRTGAGM